MQISIQANGTHGQYAISEQLQENIASCTQQKVVVKAAPDFLLPVSSLRRLIDEVHDPPLLVLEHLVGNLLVESATKKNKSSEVKHVTKAVVQALSALHEEGIVHTDVKPDNLLVNYGNGGNRFSDIKLADCGDSSHVDTVIENHVIGATMFRSPEAMLNLVWGPPTDIWSLGATLISLIWGENWQIFKPSNVDPTYSAYYTEVLRRQYKYFGPFPLSYTSLTDDDALDKLTTITEKAEKRTPFEMASSQKIMKDDREFICKSMKLDPRDRPSAKLLLQDAWLAKCTADSK
ncbi:hypothetical protein MMC29_004408 [Sticta canariensis]|nr:hypothetical protein [Sticta canariensis]